MNATATKTASAENDSAAEAQSTQGSLQLATFRVGKVQLGIDVKHVQEINRLLDVTPVPEASAKIHGVVNLRGEVVTVINAHRLFSINEEPNRKSGRNLILNLDGERIGIWVDGVSDILTIQSDDLSPRPSNVNTIDRRFFQSVYLQEENLVVVLEPVGLLAATEE